MSNSSCSLEDLIQLNREIAALVKAGIPLELGLGGLSGSVSSRLGELSERISMRMAGGVSLPKALAEEGPEVSSVYTAVLEAGLASGRLSEALESLAATSQVMLDTRRRIFLAVLYPLICAIVAYLLLSEFLWIFIPQLIHTAEAFHFPLIWPIEFAKFLYQHRLYVVTVIPSLMLLLAVVTFLLRHGLTRGLWNWVSTFRWVPGVSAIRRSQNWSQFAELLAMQLEHSSPLASSFQLAADSTDDLRWSEESDIICEQLRLGKTLTEALQLSRSLPPLARWMISSGEKQGTLPATLRQLSDSYRRRSLRQATNLKTWLPVLITVVVCGSIGLAYGLIFFIPLQALLTGLMHE